MRRSEIIDTLEKFKRVDKYESFHEILPSVVEAAEDQKNIVSNILDDCCTELIQLLKNSARPIKSHLKKELIFCMDKLSIASVDTENREFGYQLGWYLADKVAVDLRKGTEKKIWGYWQIEANEVKPPLRPRVSAKERATANEKS